MTTLLSDDEPRQRTLSAMDMVYWAQKYAIIFKPDALFNGTETNSVSLLAWACERVGLAIPTVQSDLYAYCYAGSDGGFSNVASSIRTRGMILFAPNRIAICMGMGDAIDFIGGIHVMRHLTDLSIEDWEVAAHVPGLDY